MLIKTRTDIGFEAPKESKTMMQFEAEHPDFRKSETTNIVWYTKEELYHAELEQECE